MRVKRILVVSVLLAAMLLVSLAGVALAVSQTWYLWPLSDTVGFYMLKDDRLEYLDLSVEIGASGTAIWIANQAAECDVPFPQDTWDGTLYFTSDPPAGTVRVEVGRSDGSADDFDSFGYEDLDTDATEIEFTMNFTATEFTVPVGEYLAFKVTNNTSGQVSVDTGGTNQSSFTSPATDPGYPIPELPTIVLLATGLICFAGYFGLKRRKRDYLKA